MISTAELAEMEFTGITLPEPYGSLLGKIPMDVSGAIWGPKGSGKSTMAVDMAYVLANEIGKGIYCSSEEGPGPSMQGKIKRLGAEHPDLMVTDFEGLDDLKAAVKYSGAKFVVLDSASMGYVKLAEFEAFHDWCKDQNVMLWYILHATKDGNYKGNTMMVHMPDIEIKVIEGIAETEENRFAETPREMEVVFERGKRETADGKRKNPDKDNIRRGIEAMKQVIETHQDVDKAMKHPELGWISFIWGRKGSHGFGIAHIIEQRDIEGDNDPAFKGQRGKDVAIRLPIVIDKGVVSKSFEGGRKRIIRYAGYRVVLRLDKDGKDKKWVLTGFRESQKRKNPDETAQLVSLERSYAPDAYKFTRHQEGAGFDHSQDTKTADKRENPVTFIENSEGNLNFGEISPDIGKKIKRQPGKIRLTKEGQDHVKNHMKEIKSAGFDSSIKFVEHIINRFDAIYQDRGALILAVKNTPSKMAVLRLIPYRNEDFYVIKTALPVRNDYFKKKELLWEKAQSTHRENTTPGAVSGHTSSNEKDKDGTKKKQALAQRSNPSEPLIYIGITEKVTLDNGNDELELKGEFPTFLSDDKMYIVPQDRVKEVENAVEAEAAVAGYEQWHNYQADETDYEIDWPEDAKAQPVGTALKIWYASDKIIQEGDTKGEINYYVHEFDAGKRPAVVKGDILIIGNINWNERGILN